MDDFAVPPNVNISHVEIISKSSENYISFSKKAEGYAQEHHSCA